MKIAVKVQRRLDFMETFYLLTTTSLATTTCDLNAEINVHIRNLYKIVRDFEKQKAISQKILQVFFIFTSFLP